MNGAVTNIYGADGLRTSKLESGASYNLVYDFDGTPLTHYLNNTPAGQTQEIWVNGKHYGYFSIPPLGSTAAYLVGISNDWVGTKREVHDRSGNSIATFCSLPFGDQVQTCVGSGAAFDDPTFFTGKERDAESGLDYFGARYYASAMGRFMSPDYDDEGDDPEPVPYAELENPQTLNLYAFTQNNPVSMRDFDGHASWQNCSDGSGSQCWTGDYNGEYNNGLFWNSQSNQWQQNDPTPPPPDDPAGEFTMGLTRTMLASSGSDFAYGAKQMATGMAKDFFTLGAKSLAALIPTIPLGQRTTYLYEKVGPNGEHLKYGITNDPKGRYSASELNGGRLKILATGSRSDMLQLERNLHETLPIGPEERQSNYIDIQVNNGLSPPPYDPIP